MDPYSPVGPVYDDEGMAFFTIKMDSTKIKVTLDTNEDGMPGGGDFTREEDLTKELLEFDVFLEVRMENGDEVKVVHDFFFQRPSDVEAWELVP